MGVVDAVHILGSDLLSFTPLSPLLSLNVNLSCAEGIWTDQKSPAEIWMARSRLRLKDFRGCELCLLQEGLHVL